MGTKCPVFPMPESSHFGDYGFDPQIDYFKVFKEAKRHQKGTRISAGLFPSTTTERLNQHQQEEAEGVAKKKSTKKRWWNRAFLLFWKKKHFDPQEPLPSSYETKRTITLDGASSSAAAKSYSGPVYGSVDDFLLSRKSHPGISMRKGGGRTSESDEVFDVPYLNLKDLNMARDHHRFSTSSSPIRLVT